MKALLLFVFLGGIAPILRAAEPVRLDSLLTLVALSDDQKKKLVDKLNDPDTLNEALDALGKVSVAGGAETGLDAWIKALNFRFKAFDTATAGKGTTLGFTYAYDRPAVTREFDQEAGFPVSLTFNLHAKGDVAFDPTRNPNDFLDTGGSFDLFASKGGFEAAADPGAWAARVQELNLKAAQITGKPEDLDKSPVWKELTTLVEKQLTTQYFGRASGHFSLESNQKFTSRQYAYGLHVTSVIRAWNSESAWAKYNFFDWPFALLRQVLTPDRDFEPSGRAIPALLVGLDQIDPTKNKARLLVDPDKSKYGRWRGEAVMRSEVGRIGNQKIWFVANYRIYEEFSPSRAIRAAHLDRFEYFGMGLEMKNGANFTYSTGKLPLDRESDRVFAIGYKWKL